MECHGKWPEKNVTICFALRAAIGLTAVRTTLTIRSLASADLFSHEHTHCAGAD